MGYFSEMDYMQHEEAERNSQTQVQRLADQVQYLNERLVNLEAHCLRDLSDPAYDHQFYSECLTGTWEDVNTIQGVLHALRKTKEQLRIAEMEEQRVAKEQQDRMNWRNTVWETGATPDYQIVLLSVFFPAADPSVAA